MRSLGSINEQRVGHRSQLLSRRSITATPLRAMLCDGRITLGALKATEIAAPAVPLPLYGLRGAVGMAEVTDEKHLFCALGNYRRDPPVRQVRRQELP